MQGCSQEQGSADTEVDVPPDAEGGLGCGAAEDIRVLPGGGATTSVTDESALQDGAAVYWCVLYRLTYLAKIIHVCVHHVKKY